MKKLYTLILFTTFFTFTTQAQLTITKAANEPVIGDAYLIQDYDSVTVIPKNTGVGQSWNFNTLVAGTFSETITYTTVASAPSATAFPTATMASNRGGNNWEIWKASASMLEFAGMSNGPSSDRNVFSNMGTWNNWPVAFGNSNSDAFASTEYTGTVTSTWSGNISYTATGTGTVTLPGGNVHSNCLQISKTITLSITTGTNVSVLVMSQYEYWSSITKSPIVAIEYQTATSGTVITKNYNVSINIPAQSVGLKEQQAANTNLIVFPNPASNDVSVFLPNNAIASSIEIIDVTGKIVASTLNANTINVSTLAKAIYTIRVKTKDSILQKSLAITE